MHNTKWSNVTKCISKLQNEGARPIDFFSGVPHIVYKLLHIAGIYHLFPPCNAGFLSALILLTPVLLHQMMLSLAVVFFIMCPIFSSLTLQEECQFW